MKVNFWKYQGTGNDFVIFDNRERKLPTNDKDLWAKVCDRNYGVGADGILFLEESKNADLKMVYLNSDGGEVAMCGNGARCLLGFAKNLGHLTSESGTLETRDETYKFMFKDIV